MDLRRAPFVRWFFKPISKRDLASELKAEVFRNVEKYHVLEQRGFISEELASSVWEDAQGLSGQLPSEVLDHYAAVKELSEVFQQVKDLEEVYSASIEHKTRENALVLDRQKDLLQDKFVELRDKVLVAKDVVEAIGL